MKNSLIASLLFLAVMFTGCSKAPGKTDTKFRMGIAALVDITNVGAGGAMLWGRSDSGEMFGSVITPSSPLELTLNNGNWTFWAVAWQGNGTPKKLVGTVRCAKNSVSLNGTDAQINLSLNNSTCALGDFSPTVNVSGGIYRFPKVSQFECNNLTDHKGRGCGLNVGAKSVRKRFFLHGFKKGKDGVLSLDGQKLESECMASHQTLTSEEIPGGNGILPIYTTLESYFSSSTCDDNDPKGKKIAVYELGFYGTARLDTLKMVNEGSCNTTGITQAQCLELGGSWSSICSLPAGAEFDISKAKCDSLGKTYTVSAIDKRIGLITTIPDFELCSSSRLSLSSTSPHPFASGDGSLQSPYTICREWQLNEIGKTASYNTSHFSLNANLDMNMTSALGTDGQPSPLCANDPGVTYLPIGSNYDGACLEGAVNSFSGKFNGNNYTIKNIRVRSKSTDTGFVRQGGTITNLILENVEMEGAQNVGAVSGSGAQKIENVTVKNADIRGRDKIGGIAGIFDTMANPLKNVHVKQAIIDLDNSTGGRAGGILGDTNSAGIIVRQSSFEGIIKSYSSAESIGGIIGYVSGGGTFTIEDSYTTGALLSSGTASASAGGLIGWNNGATVVHRSYSRMSIGPNSNQMALGAANLGGLVGGRSGSNVDLNYAYYYGSIMHPCFEGTTTHCRSATNVLLGNSVPSSQPGTKGVMLNSAISDFVFTQETTEADIKNTTYLSSLTSNGYSNTGGPMPRLAWENSACSLSLNNSSIASQVASGRGTVTNPVVLCNEDQWKNIKFYNDKHYVLYDNLTLSGLTIADSPDSFTGTIDGKGHIVSGFYIEAGASVNGGLFKSLNGKIKDVHFVAGYISGNTSSNIGIFAVINSTGEVSQVEFDSVKVMGSASQAGVISGTNNGKILFSYVNSILEAAAPNTGMVAGINSGTGEIKGVRAEGRHKVIDNANTVYAGGVAGTNSGTIKEVDSSVELINDSTNGNNLSASRLGALIGYQTGVAEDILLRPYARMRLEKISPRMGHIFGYTGSSSVNRRIVAANEVPLDNGLAHVNVYHTTGENAGGTFENIKTLANAVFKYNPTALPATNSCSFDGTSTYTYDLISTFSKGGFNDGFWLSNFHYGSSISSRITGSHVDGSSATITSGNGDFTIPCGSDGFDPGKTLHAVTNFGNFPSSHVYLPRQFKDIDEFCPSGISSTDVNFQCASSDFDIVQDVVNGRGFNRMLNAYKSWVSTNQPPASYPKWTLGDDGYPRLFIVD